MSDLEHLRIAAKRLERYAQRAREKLWHGERNDLIRALPYIAETGEIARRLYKALEQLLKIL
jgi:hypothetical protein